MQEKPNTKEFTISRTFNAPKELIFKVFTEAEHLRQWWGPKGFKMGTINLDFKPGGVFHYSMVAENGMEMWGKFVYREINPYDRIVFVNSFSDAQGGTTVHPMAPNWPKEVLNVMTLEEVEGKTTMTLRGHPINAGDEEAALFHNSYPSMQQGFKGTWDQLEEYLKTLQNMTVSALA
jgi:uncharacterized protein YndB with AHSA1/START domain